MAGPQSLKPRPVSASRPVRRFTLAQANKSLPLVKRIVGDIVRTHGEALKAQSDLEHVPAGTTPQDIQRRLESHLEHLEDFVDELTEVGCELKDYRMGLIDFTGRHKGRDVCLCWKLGEETVGYWHEINAGFAGRQPIATLRESN